MTTVDTTTDPFEGCQRWGIAQDVAIALSSIRLGQAPGDLPALSRHRLDGAEFALCALVDGEALPLAIIPLDWPTDYHEWAACSEWPIADETLRATAAELMATARTMLSALANGSLGAHDQLRGRLQGAIRALDLFDTELVTSRTAEEIVELIKIDRPAWRDLLRETSPP